MNIKYFGLTIALFAALLVKADDIRDFLAGCIKADQHISSAEKTALPITSRNPNQAEALYVAADKIVIFQAISQQKNQELRFYNMQKTMLRKRIENAALQAFEYQFIRNALPDGIPENIQLELCRYFSGSWKFHIANGVKITQFDGKNGEFALAAVLYHRQVTFPDGKPDMNQIRRAAVTRLPDTIAAQMPQGKTPQLREIARLANILYSMDNTHPYISIARYIVAGFASGTITENDAAAITVIFAELPENVQENLLIAAENLGREKDMETFLDQILANDKKSDKKTESSTL